MGSNDVKCGSTKVALGAVIRWIYSISQVKGGVLFRKLSGWYIRLNSFDVQTLYNSILQRLLGWYMWFLDVSI